MKSRVFSCFANFKSLKIKFLIYLRIKKLFLHIKPSAIRDLERGVGFLQAKGIGKWRKSGQLAVQCNIPQIDV